MPIELAGITLNRIHKVATLENADFPGHRIPGLAGTVFQDTGRHSTRLLVEGIYYGENAKEDLEKLRDVYKKREETDFLAEIVGQAYFSQVVIDRLEVVQAAADPEQFSFRMVLAEYVPPPAPEAGFGLPGVDDLLALDALDFMDMIQLPDLLSVPGFGDPTPPLRTVLDSVGGVLNEANQPAQELSDLFGADTTARSSSLPLSGQVTTQVDDQSVLNLIEDQLNRLFSADETTDGALNQAAGSIAGVERFVSNVAPPNINRNALLEQGFGAIRALLPTDVSQALGGLDGQIDGFFNGLQSDLVDPFGGILDNFRRLQQLGLGAGASAPPENMDIGFPMPVPDGNPVARGRNVQALTSQLENLLALLPNPLDAQALLQLAYEQLASLPRENVPLQNIPFYDELHDKLETALTWLQSDGAELGTHFVQTLHSFDAFIRASFHEHGIQPLQLQMQELQDQVNIADLKQLLDAIAAGFNQLAARVRNGSFGANNAGDIADLETRVETLRNTAQAIQTQWMQTTGRELGDKLATLDESLEERMAELLLLGAPSPDLSLIALAAQPLNQLFETLGVRAFISGIHEFSNTVAGIIEMLNLPQISAIIQDVLDRATQAIQVFSNLLVNITVEFSMLINRVEQAIEGLGITALIDELRGLLERFEQEVVNGLNSVFSPVRNFLQGAFDQINNLVAAFDPRAILQSVVDLLQTLTDILGNPALQETIKRLKDALEGVNNALGGFSFTVVSDPVVSGIGVVKSAMNIAGRLPLPDSIAREVKAALKTLPKSEHLRTLAGRLETGLDEIVEQGPKPVLLAVKDKPAELIAEVEKYAPARFLGDRLSEPYQEFVSKLEELKPTKLMEPISAALNNLLDELREAANPMILFDALQEPYQALYNALDGLNPQALVEPLQEKLSEGIRAVTSRLPLDAADEIFSVADSIAGELRRALDSAAALRDALTAVNDRIAGLGDSENQVRQWGDSIAAKLDELSDFGAVTAAFQDVETAVNSIQGASLQQALFDPMDGLLAPLRDLEPQNRLIALVQAQRGFPRTLLEGLDDTPEKSALLALLARFDPMHRLYTGALGGMQDQLEDWSAQRERLAAFFIVWQDRYFLPGGPLSRYRQPGISAAELKTLMATVIREQFTNAVAPVFRLVEHIQMLINAVLSELTSLIQRLEIQVESLLQINDALTRLREAVRQIVDQLNNLDITFIAREIEGVFDAVKTQLEALDPQRIGMILKTTFDRLLDAIDPNVLLGLADLDQRHKTLIDLLRDRDPKAILTDTLQPEYDKIVEFLRQLDISLIIETFLLRLEGLQTQLGAELERIISAYDEMLLAVPASLGGEIGASFRIN